MGISLLTYLLKEMPQTQCQAGHMSQRLQDFSDFSHDLFHFYNFKKTKIPSSFLFPNTSFLQEVELRICVGLYAQLN